MFAERKYVKIIKIACAWTLLLAAIFLLSNFAWAAEVETGLDYAADTGLSVADPRVIIAKIIRIVIGFLGIVAVGLIMYAGWIWMTSEGNEEKIEQAKKILTNAVIGLIIILSAFAIVSFIINSLIGATGGGQQNDNKAQSGQYSFGMSAFENGDIKDVYPARGQQDVPRNTSILITFKQAIKPESLISGGKINTASMQIRKSGDSRLVTEDINFLAVTGDNETFVFTPDKYLGSPSEKISYIISLTLKNIIKSGDDKPITNPWSEWSFEVSDKIDLTPPQVKNSGVFPVPDNIKDTVESLSVAKQAEGKIEIKAKPNIYSDAEVVSVNKSAGATWSAATSTVSRDCNQAGELAVSYNGGAVKLSDSADRLIGQGSIAGRTATFNVCNLKLTLTQAGASFNEGNLWTVTVRAMVSADTLIVGDITYTASTTNSEATFKVEDNSDTAANLAGSLAGNSEVRAIAAGAVITVIAKVAGQAGNDIILTSSNQSRLAITGMSGGADKQEKVTVNDRTDMARNAVIRIDFNEAVNPLTVSGKSEDIKNYIQVVNLNTDTIVPGVFKVSNQYKTVEFISNNECGVNACGEKIYCLPENAHLLVSFKAAALADCGADNCASKSPFNICSSASHCQNSAQENYPLSTQPLTGVADLAANSLDGNRDGQAQGPVSYYNENSQAAADGDNFKWSFFTNDKIDLTGPEIIFTRQADKDGQEQDSAINQHLYNPLLIYFNKIMMSSSLNTGETVINNGQENITHKLINLWNFANKSLGYWIANEMVESTAPGIVPDGAPDWTKVYIYHTGLAEATVYRAQAGSGVKDIYQNCYKPSKGVGCISGVDDNNPSCCSGTPTANLPASGNCP